MLTFCERHLNSLLQHVLTKFSLTSNLSVHTECVERETAAASQQDILDWMSSYKGKDFEILQ